MVQVGPRSRSVDAVQPGHKRHLDVMAVTMTGVRLYLWRAIIVVGRTPSLSQARSWTSEYPAAAADRIDTGQVGRG